MTNKKEQEKFLKSTYLNRLKTRTSLRFEVHLTDHCNLNCIGCLHFAPLAEKYFLNIKEYEQDCKQLSNLLNGEIESICLLGGEPLLHPQITEIMEITRKHFPVGEIIIVTNGILLFKLDNFFWKKCHDNSIGISITKYPISLEFDFLEKKAKHYGITFKYFKIIKEFSKSSLDKEGSQNIIDNSKSCGMINYCIQLRNGKLFTCPLVAYIDIFNRYFNESFQITDKDYVDIYKIKDKYEIFNFLCKPFPFCRYCNIEKLEYNIPWQPSKKQISEWI
jgi:MoaA/NifB/PqqE/SkfB family radical SAM enzyme